MPPGIRRLQPQLASVAGITGTAPVQDRPSIARQPHALCRRRNPHQYCGGEEPWRPAGLCRSGRIGERPAEEAAGYVEITASAGALGYSGAIRQTRCTTPDSAWATIFTQSRHLTRVPTQAQDQQAPDRARPVRPPERQRNPAASAPGSVRHQPARMQLARTVLPAHRYSWEETWHLGHGFPAAPAAPRPLSSDNFKSWHRPARTNRGPFRHGR